MIGVGIRTNIGSISSSVYTWTTLISGQIRYRRGIDRVTLQYVLDRSENGGATWETLISENRTEDTILQDKGHLYRHRIVDYEYHIDQTLTGTGYAGTEGVDWENLGVFIGAYVPVNFLTTNSGADNVAALNDALTNHRSVKITTPGVYEIDGTIWIPSNTKLEFVAGCTIKKMANIPVQYTHVFANKGCLTGTRNSNISLIGNGLVVEVNGIHDINTTYRMRGNLNFFRVDGLIVSGIYNDDNEADQYFSHGADLTSFNYSHFDLSGHKDGLNFCGPLNNGVIEDIAVDTNDDGIILMTNNGSVVAPSLGDIQNIALNRITGNGISHPTTPRFRIASSSWANWAGGNTYDLSDLCVNAGNIYIKDNTVAMVAANAPVHISGSVTGADGIKWSWLQAGTITEANVKNVTITTFNCGGGNLPFNFSADSWAGEYRSYYPGTEGNSYIENIIIDGMTWSASGGATYNAFRGEGAIKKFTLKNSNLDLTGTSGALYYAYTTIGTVPFENINIENCNIKLPNATNYLFYKSSSHIGNIINVSDSVINCGGQDLILAGSNEHIDLTLINTTIDHVGRLINCLTANNDIVANGCTFTNCHRLCYAENLNQTITFTSDGCTFGNPTIMLFDQATIALTGLTINVTNSIGSPDTAKITNGYVDIINCSLYDDKGYGGELVINGDFAVSTGWSVTVGANWTIGSGKASYDGVSASVLSRACVIELNKYYRVSFKISDRVGVIRLLMVNAAGTVIPFMGVLTGWRDYANGVHTYIVKCTTGVLDFGVAGNTTKAFGIDDISIKEILT
jgi:hypothetical protein